MNKPALKLVKAAFFLAILLTAGTVWAVNPFAGEQSIMPEAENAATSLGNSGTADQAYIKAASETESIEKRISGAFIQPWESDNDRPCEFWTTELQAMKAIGIDTVIIQFNQYNGVNFSEATENILNVADELEMKVFIGTALNEEGWYTNKILPTFLARESKIVAEYTTILVNQFKPHKSFIGVYIPYEDNTLSLPGPMGDFYGRIADAARAAKPDLKILISPYTTPRPGMALSLPKVALNAYFRKMLKRAKVDICAWQDGVGGTRKQLERVSHDLGPIVKTCKALKIEAWANLEVFHRTTPLSEDFAAEATDLETLKKQIAAEGPLVKKLICFDFNHYFSPNAADKTAHRLYEEYLKMLQTPDSEDSSPTTN